MFFCGFLQTMKKFLSLSLSNEFSQIMESGTSHGKKSMIDTKKIIRQVISYFHIMIGSEIVKHRIHYHSLPLIPLMTF
jgi:hypothetical protein